MSKKAYFFIDDVIWCLRDITREKPKSIFDQHFFKALKEAHDKYGAKVQLNIFYRTDFYYGNDEFTLDDVTDAYKAEFEAASDWLKFCFHSKQEFPDYPFINATYEDMYDIFKMTERNVFRFAGKNSFTYGGTPHWGPISKAACKALYDCGMKVIWASHGEKSEYSGDPSTLPYGHAQRLLNNRQPETMLYTRPTLEAFIERSICGHNHLLPAEAETTIGTFKTIEDKETGLHFKVVGGSACVNHLTHETIEENYAPFLNDEYFCIASHEQYSYPDYLAYRPRHSELLVRACEIVHNAGYEFFYLEELVK